MAGTIIDSIAAQIIAAARPCLLTLSILRRAWQYCRACCICHLSIPENTDMSKRVVASLAFVSLIVSTPARAADGLKINDRTISKCRA